MSSENCHKMLLENAKKRNTFYLRPYDFSDSVTMPCISCDSGVNFKWYFIKRNNFPIVNFDYANFTYGSYLQLLQTGNLITDMNTYCLTHENGLRIKSFDPEKVLGTYYCETDDNITKFIWHHVDTFYLEDDPNYARMAVHILTKSASKIKSSLTDIEDELNKKFPNSLFQSNLVKVFYEFLPKPSAKSLCGDIKLKYIKRCYFQIPRNISESRPLTAVEYGYYWTIFHAVGFLFEFKSMSEKENGRAFIALKSKALNVASVLGFSIKDNANDIIIPCHFSFLKHLQFVPKMGNPFSFSNQYGMVEIQINCPQIDPMDIIKLAMAKDVGKLKIKILGEVERSMKSVDKLYLDGSVNERLICGYSKKGADICSNKRTDVQWRKRKYVFSIESILKQRIYVEKDCQLLFTEIKLKDRGMYHCYRKTVDRKSWNISPTTKFLIQVDRAKNPMPNMMEVMKYLTLLILWTVFIFSIWVILSISNIRIKVKARYRAEERAKFLKTQERRKNFDSSQLVSSINLHGQQIQEHLKDKKAD